MSETGSVDIYSLYKKTLIAVLIGAVCLIGLTCAYIFLMGPVKQMPSAPGVQEINHAGTTAAAENTTTAQLQDSKESISLFLNTNSADSDYLWIPIAEGISSSDISIENHYMDRQLWVVISGGSEDFYRNEYISGNLEGVSTAEAIMDGSRLVLRFGMDKVYEYNTIFENGVLYVDKVMPREVYDRIVVIDPAGYVPPELLNPESVSPARICQDISSKLLSTLESRDIRVYVTSLDERICDSEEAIAFLNEVKPDMYIRIETSYDEDTKEYGTQTVYNGTYFIPGFGSVELADLLEVNVTTAIGGKAMGLFEAGENDEVIKNATVPAATVKVGYYTNMQENILLNRDDYRTRIAEGIAAAVTSAYEEE